MPLLGELGRGCASCSSPWAGLTKLMQHPLCCAPFERRPLPEDLRISVVMGSTAPALQQVRVLAQGMPWPTEVAVDVTDMAMRMAAADLCISAGGGTTWERQFLQLPSLVIPIAENQVDYLKLLERKNLVNLFQSPHRID